jgi:hypothetical protein
MAKRLTMFTFGYWGWGNETSLLLKASAAVELTRGFAPPMFVDIRISRSARAVGFRSDAFERLAGRTRYVWMPALGNRAVRDHLGNKIIVDKPKAAGELLELAIERAKNKQRLIVFCACQFPGAPRRPMCHRRSAAELVLAEATRRRVPTDIVEWPGGQPTPISVRVTPAELRKLAASSGTPLAPNWAMGKISSVASGSRVEARSGDEVAVFLAQAAKPKRGTLVTRSLFGAMTIGMRRGENTRPGWGLAFSAQP